FMSSGWSLKRLHKLILSSTVYRQSSTRQTEGDAVDPSNQLYWRKSVVRLDAEVVRDRMLAASGELERSMFGAPAPISVHATGQIVTASARRSIYLQARRTQPVAMLKEFDAPVMQTNCDQRPSSTVASQALLLMNSDFILQRAVAFARRLRAETLSTTTGNPEQLAEQAKRAWRLAYARSASADEERTAREFLATQLPLLKERDAARREREKEAAAKKSDDEKKNEDKKKDKKKGEEPLDPELQALTNLCQALLSSNEFLYVD
ncbi:MAG: DUF1553 domain-containing protein, partial [Planctomycetes bacterium]|nr:DUF1553 domain-containing protein [Planctomycetota bacterium]